MKYIPILFSAPMVRAILVGTKTQTRRAMKPQPEPYGDGWRWLHRTGSICCAVGDTPSIYAPWVPGDRLWVREEHYRFGHWELVEGKLTKGGRQKWAFVADSEELRFEPPGEYRKGRHSKDPATPAWHKRLARFMPRRCSRITLEVVSVRVERLTGISKEDARAEGAARSFRSDGVASYVDGFQYLWESINGDGSWDANPWVWVIEFVRVSLGWE